MPAGEEIIILGWSDCSRVLEDVSARLGEMPPGGRIRVLFSNRDFAIDLSAFCHETGNRLLDLGAQDDKFYAVIEKV
ncbi:MAG: sulfurtransferase TusA family protein [candidate division WOR-3 bacterium]